MCVDHVSGLHHRLYGNNCIEDSLTSSIHAQCSAIEKAALIDMLVQ